MQARNKFEIRVCSPPSEEPTLLFLKLRCLRYTWGMSELVKIVVHVPETHADAVRQAIGVAGGGRIGNYTFCSFSVKGIGRFKPEEGAHPAIGAVGKYEEVPEERIEITSEQERVSVVLAAIRDAHPYEEPTIDVYPLLTPGVETYEISV